MVDPGNRLVANTLEAEWNDKLRVLAKARDDREREIREDRVALDEKVRKRLVVMTTDFKKLWGDPTLPNRERKRLLAHIIEDVTLIKLASEGTTKIHVRLETSPGLSMDVLPNTGSGSARCGSGRRRSRPGAREP